MPNFWKLITFVGDKPVSTLCLGINVSFQKALVYYWSLQQLPRSSFVTLPTVCSNYIRLNSHFASISVNRSLHFFPLWTPENAPPADWKPPEGRVLSAWPLSWSRALARCLVWPVALRNRRAENLTKSLHQQLWWLLYNLALNCLLSRVL